MELVGVVSAEIRNSRLTRAPLSCVDCQSADYPMVPTGTYAGTVDLRLEVTGDPEHGIPFGQDRLIPIWFATLAVRQKSRMVKLRSAAEILEEFDLPKGQGRLHYRRLLDGFKRVFKSTIYFGTEESSGRDKVWDCQRFHFFDRAADLV